MKRNIIFSVVGLGLMYFILIYYVPHWHEESSGCYLHHEVYVQNIRSKIEKKLIDSHNHNYKEIIYLDENKEEKTMVFTPEFQVMFDSLNVGDTIIKEKNSIYYKIKYNKLQKDTIFQFYTMCKDSINKPKP